LLELLQKLHDLYADDYPKFTAAFSEAVKSPTKTAYGEELKTNVNMCELYGRMIGQDSLRLMKAPARCRIPVLFLALLIPVVAGKLAAAEDQPGADSALVVDVYSGAVAPDPIQEKAFWLWLETLTKTEEPDAGGVPRVIHIEHPLSDKDFDIVGQGDANGEKVVVQGHVSRQADGKFKVAFQSSGARRLILARQSLR
jgi:hypothetical protein